MSEPTQERFVHTQHTPDTWLNVTSEDPATYSPELRDTDGIQRDDAGRLSEAIRSQDYAGASKEIMRRSVKRSEAGELTMDHTHFKYRAADGQVQAEEGFHRAGEQAGEHWLKRFERTQVDGTTVTTEYGRIAEPAANNAKAKGHEWKVVSQAIDGGVREVRTFTHGLSGNQERASLNDLPTLYPDGVQLTRIERDMTGDGGKQISETYYGILPGSDSEVKLFNRDRTK